MFKKRNTFYACSLIDSIQLTCANGMITLPSSVVLGSSTSTRSVVTPA